MTQPQISYTERKALASAWLEENRLRIYADETMDRCLAWCNDALNQGDTLALDSGFGHDDREVWASIGVDASCVPVDVAIRENLAHRTVTDIAMEDVVDDLVIRGQTIVHRTEEAYPVLRQLTVDDGQSWTTGL